MGSTSGFDSRFELDELQNIIDIIGGSPKSVQQRQLNALVNLGLGTGTPATTDFVGSTAGALVGGVVGLGQGGLLVLGAVAAQVVLTGTATLSGSSTAAQAAFATATHGGSTNGAVALPVGQYYFEASLYLADNGTTSHTWSTLFGGTAVIGQINYSISGINGNSSGTPATGGLLGMAAVATAIVATPASTASAIFTIQLAGTFTVTTAGTVILQVKSSAAGGGTTVTMNAGSFMIINQLANVSPVGTWS